MGFSVHAGLSKHHIDWVNSLLKIIKSFRSANPPDCRGWEEKI